MARNVSLRELSVGVEGLALLRHLHEGTDDVAAQRLAEVRCAISAPGWRSWLAC